MERARRAAMPYKMARKLLPQFFTKEKLMTQTCTQQKPRKPPWPQANRDKLELLLGNDTNL